MLLSKNSWLTNTKSRPSPLISWLLLMLIANVFHGHCNKLTRTKVIPQQFIDCVWHPGQFHPTLARKDAWPLIKSDMWVLAMHFVSLKKYLAVGEFDKSDAMTQPVDACCKPNQQCPRLMWHSTVLSSCLMRSVFWCKTAYSETEICLKRTDDDL